MGNKILKQHYHSCNITSRVLCKYTTFLQLWPWEVFTTRLAFSMGTEHLISAWPAPCSFQNLNICSLYTSKNPDLGCPTSATGVRLHCWWLWDILGERLRGTSRGQPTGEISSSVTGHSFFTAHVSVSPVVWRKLMALLSRSKTNEACTTPHTTRWMSSVGKLGEWELQCPSLALF